MRKSKHVTIEMEGRDKGKRFLITEMSALIGERWARRAFMAIMKAGGNVDGYTIGAGWEQLAYAGFARLGQLDMDVAEPLWDELLTCVKFMPNPSDATVVRDLVLNGDGADIQEITTIFQLKVEAFNIHANFSDSGKKSTSTPATEKTTSGPSSPSTATSPAQSQPSFHVPRRPGKTLRRTTG